MSEVEKSLNKLLFEFFFDSLEDVTKTVVFMSNVLGRMMVGMAVVYFFNNDLMLTKRLNPFMFAVLSISIMLWSVMPLLMEIKCATKQSARGLRHKRILKGREHDREN